MFARASIIEVPFILVFIFELDFPHVIKASIPEGPCLTGAILSNRRLKTVSEGVVIDTMPVSLVINELTYQSALILEGYFPLADAFVIHEFTFVDVPVLEVVCASPVSLGVFEVTLIILSV